MSSSAQQPMPVSARVFACFASTLDGKIGCAQFPDDRVGSRADLEHLLTVRNQADAVLCGGETFRHWPQTRKGNQQDKPPLQCILTQSFDLPPDAPVFQEAAISGTPLLVVSPKTPNEALRQQYPAHIEWITSGEDNSVHVAIKALEAKGKKNILIEGGGHIFHMALSAKVVHEIYLTLCPLFLAGADNPNLVTGEGFRITQAPKTRVIEQKWHEQELYFHLAIDYPAPFS